jgi:large subunit ribosomal protein L32e
MSKDFPRKDYHKFKKLSTSWRKPRGLDNKIKHAYKGHGWKVKIGYGTQKNKPQIIVISCVADLQKLKTLSNYSALLLSNLGNRKRALLLQKATELGIKIANVKPDFIQKLDQEMKARKDQRVVYSKKKEAKKAEVDKKSEKSTEKLDSKLTDEDKKKAEKQEKDKILTKKEGI